MRRPIAVLVALAALAAGFPAGAGAGAPHDGFVVYKDLRGRGVTEVRDANGRLLSAEALAGRGGDELPACLDPRARFFGPIWTDSGPVFYVNEGSVPAYLEPAAALRSLLRGNDAWQSPFSTDCPLDAPGSSYRSVYGGPTERAASLADGLTADGVSVVEFRSLAGTMCDGALACTIVDFERGRIREADVLFESDLTRYGFADYWTTADTTWTTSAEGRFALVDVAAHEFGHFAGLDHADHSPALTMYPLIHDGMQTLGLGDMRGLRARY